MTSAPAAVLREDGHERPFKNWLIGEPDLGYFAAYPSVKHRPRFVLTKNDYWSRAANFRLAMDIQVLTRGLGPNYRRIGRLGSPMPSGVTFHPSDMAWATISSVRSLAPLLATKTKAPASVFGHRRSRPGPVRGKHRRGPDEKASGPCPPRSDMLASFAVGIFPFNLAL
jgi:hypothetical protein